MNIGLMIGNIVEQTDGGGSTFQIELLKALQRLSTKHVYYVYYVATKKCFEDTNNVKFIHIKKYNKYICVKVKNKYSLNKYVKQDNIRLMIFVGCAYEFVSCPYFFTVWDLNHRTDPYFPELCNNGQFSEREKVYYPILAAASRVIIGNEIGKKHIEKYYNVSPDNIRINPMFTPNYVYEVEPDVSVLSKFNIQKDKFIIYPAQFWTHKNHIRLIEAMSILNKEGSDLKAILTGSDKGNFEYIKKKVKEYNIEDKVIFTGFITQAELICLYKNAYALVYLSLCGPDNIPPLEAMALNCPAIVSGIEGHREQLKDCALFFEQLNATDLANKIKLINNDELRKSLIQKGQILAQERHVDNYANNLDREVCEFEKIRICWE